MSCNVAFKASLDGMWSQSSLDKTVAWSLTQGKNNDMLTWEVKIETWAMQAMSLCLHCISKSVIK